MYRIVILLIIISGCRGDLNNLPINSELTNEFVIVKDLNNSKYIVSYDDLRGITGSTAENINTGINFRKELLKGNKFLKEKDINIVKGSGGYIFKIEHFDSFSPKQFLSVDTIKLSLEQNILPLQLVDEENKGALIEFFILNKRRVAFDEYRGFFMLSQE